jgi:hypothetical protein
VLKDRVRQHAVRQCHGDLHLANIVLWQQHPTLFDALEFNLEMATVDTLYDLAFLLMDLLHHGQKRAANWVLNRYLWRSASRGDLEALALLPLFVACRAGIRALVAVTRATQRRPDPQSSAAGETARAYMRLAIDALQPAVPRLIAVGGLSGTGKSTLAAALAPHLPDLTGALHLRSDLERKAMFGVAETERLPPQSYTPEMAARVYERLLDRASAALGAGHSVIVDAVFATKGERDALEQRAAGHGAAFDGLWLEADPATLTDRVARRTGDASDATPAVIARQLGYDIGPMSWTRVPAGGPAPATLALALRHLKLAP